MAKYEEQNQLDYRFGGDTLDDFAQKYMREITRVFRFLNDIRGNTTNSIEYTEATEGQFKVEDNKLYIRNSTNTAWVFLGEIKDCFGFKEASTEFLSTADLTKAKIATINNLDMTKALTTDQISLSKVTEINNLDMTKALTTDNLSLAKVADVNALDFDKVLTTDEISTSKVSDINNLDFSKVLTTSDIGTTAGKIPKFASNGLLDASISGNAGKLGGYVISTNSIADGDALMYSASSNGWINQSVSAVASKVEFDSAGDVMPVA